MNQLISTNQQLTMSSQEMAELTGIRHDSVLRTIKSLVDKGILLNTNCGEYKDASGKVNKCYKSDKRDSLVIVARLSPEFTAVVVDRWQELESQQAKPLTMTEMLIQQAIALDNQAKQLAQIENKVAVLEAKQETETHDYFTVAGYTSLSGKKVSASEANLIGRKCAKLSKELEYPVRKQHSEIFGTVNSYHIDILASIVK